MKNRRIVYFLLFLNVIAVSIAIALGVHQGRPTKHFGEWRLITYLSTIQLLAVSWLSYRILQVRRLAQGQFIKRTAFSLWAIISLGFLFLAADEFFSIHESIDNIIHRIFHLKETGVTDRIDDIVIVFYGIIGMGVLYLYRKELIIFKKVLPFLIYGFCLLFSTSILDMVTSRMDIISMLVAPGFVDTLEVWLRVAEESLKVFAEACFVIGFYSALEIAKQNNIDKTS